MRKPFPTAQIKFHSPVLTPMLRSTRDSNLTLQKLTPTTRIKVDNLFSEWSEF